MHGMVDSHLAAPVVPPPTGAVLSGVVRSGDPADSVTFVEEGFLKGAKVRVRETLTARGPRSIYHKVEIEQGNGYQLMAEDTCAK